MKKLYIAVGLSAMILSGCTTTDVQTTANSATNIGMNIFKSAVDSKCRSELNNNGIYKTASIFMTDSQKTTLENKVCGCVSDKAPQSVTLAELGQAALDPTARTQIVGKAVVKTLNACVSEFVGGATSTGS